MARLRLNVQEANGELPMICMALRRAGNRHVHTGYVVVPALGSGCSPSGGCSRCSSSCSSSPSVRRLQAPFCDEHKGHWSRRRLIGFGSLVLMVLFIIGEVVLVSNVPRAAQDAGSPALRSWPARSPCSPGWSCSSSCRAPRLGLPEFTETDLWLDGVAPACIDALEETRTAAPSPASADLVPTPRRGGRVHPSARASRRRDSARHVRAENDPAATRFRNDFRGASAAPPPLPPFSRDAIAGARASLRALLRVCVKNAIAPFVLPQHGQPIG